MEYFFLALVFGYTILAFLCYVAIYYQHFSHRRSAGSILHRFGMSSLGAARTGNWGPALGKALPCFGLMVIGGYAHRPWIDAVCLFGSLGILQVWYFLRRDKHIWLAVLALLLLAGFGLRLIAASITGVGEVAPKFLSVVCGILLLIGSASTYFNLTRGTRIYEAGIDTEWSFYPWEFICGFQWHSIGDNYDLVFRTTTPVVWILGIQVNPERVVEILIPVPAADKPAIEALLSDRCERKSARDGNL